MHPRRLRCGAAVWCVCLMCGGALQALAARRTSLLLACLLLVRGTAGKGTYPDMNERASLERVIRERSSDGQLVLYTYLASGPASKMWQDLALEMSDQLNRLAYPYIVLAHDASGCDELLAAAVGRVKPAPYCVLDGMMRKARGYAQHGTVFTLWIRRYHTAARLAEAGVGVTLLDADTVLTRNMLPVLKQLEREYALIGLGEGPMNGGTWHLRASNSSSAALWVIKQIERRSTLYQNFKPRWGGVDPGLRMDQVNKSCVLLQSVGVTYDLAFYAHRKSWVTRCVWQRRRTAARSTSGTTSRIRSTRSMSSGDAFSRPNPSFSFSGR